MNITSFLFLFKASLIIRNDCKMNVVRQSIGVLFIKCLHRKLFQQLFLISRLHFFLSVFAISRFVIEKCFFLCNRKIWISTQQFLLKKQKERERFCNTAIVVCMPWPGANVIKTFNGPNLRIFLISQSVCSWQAFLAY